MKNFIVLLLSAVIVSTSALYPKIEGELQVPVLLSPADSAVNTTIPVTLSWNVFTGAVAYRVQVASDLAFSTIVEEDSVGSVTTSLQYPDLSNSTQYFWRVKALTSADSTEWSAVWNFTTIIAAPAQVVLLSPANNAVNQAINTSLTWNALSGAETYQLQVATDANFVSIVKDTSLSSTSKQMWGLSNSTKYYWRVRASNVGGTGSWSEMWNFTTIIAAPGQLTLSSPANNATNQALNVNLSWNQLSGAETYQLQVATDANFVSIVKDSSLSGTSKQMWGLLNSTKYYWRVRASNLGGTGNWSEVWNFTTIIAAPAQVVLLSPANNAVNQAINTSLTWNALSGAETYQLQVATDANFVSIVKDSSLSGTSKQMWGLLNSTKYYWRVRASNLGGTGNWSEVWNFTTIIAAPAQVVLLSPANNAVNQAINTSLTWNALSGAETYQLQVATDANFVSIIKDTSLSSTSKQMWGLLNSTKYYWRVRASNVGGTGSWSEVWNFTTIVAAPGQVVLSSPANNSKGLLNPVTVSWNSSARAEKYILQVSTINDFSTLVVNDSNQTGLSEVLPTLNYYTKYFWRVKSVNVGGQSDWSATWNFKTLGNPYASTLFIPANNSVNQPINGLIFKWSKAQERIETIQKYQFQLATDAQFTTIITNDSTLTDTTKSLTGLTYLTKYYWRVRALNQTGWGDWSAVWNTTTIIEKPANFTLSAPANNSKGLLNPVTLTWNSSARAEKYILQVSTSNTFNTFVVNDSNQTDLTEVLPTLNNYTEYFWRVKSVNVGGQSDWSATWNFKTLGNPYASTLYVPADSSVNQPVMGLLFRWSKPQERIEAIQKYQFQLDVDSAFTNPVRNDSTLTDSSYTISGTELTHNKKHFWRVRASNQTGWGDWSVVRNFTTYDIYITLDVPSGGEKWQIGRSKTISWTNINAGDKVKLEYSTNNGGIWLPVKDTVANASVYQWMIPNTTAAQAKVRVSSLKYPFASDTSDSFRLVNLILSSPNGGDTLVRGSMRTISWLNDQLNPADSVIIQYSTNDGIGWLPVTQSSIPNIGSYAWTVPASLSTAARVKVIDASDTTIHDASDNPFIVTQAVVSVTHPNGGEFIEVNSSYTIRWNVTSTSGTVKIEYSTNNGQQWSVVVPEITASAGSYNWNVPNTPSQNCRVRVSSNTFPYAVDSSNAVFTIQNLEITSPNTPVRWQGNSFKNITWKINRGPSDDLTTVKLDYSLNGGAAWYNIVQSVPVSPGSYTWLVPDSSSNECLVRVVDNNSASVFDRSDTVFTIFQSRISIGWPGSNSRQQAKDTVTVTWTRQNIDTFEVRYRSRAQNPWQVIARNLTGGSFNWRLPDTVSNAAQFGVFDQTNDRIKDSVTFEIYQSAISVTSPVMNDSLQATGNWLIKWDKIEVPRVTLSYSANGGIVWNPIVSDQIGTQFLWPSVPDIESDNVRLKIADADNDSVYGISVPFKIYKSSLAIASPVNGQRIQGKGKVTIRWNYVRVKNLKIEYSLDGGSYTQMVDSIPVAVGSYIWSNIPDMNAPNAAIRISDTQNENVFSRIGIEIFKSSLVISDPEAAVRWQMQSVQEIKWDAGDVDSVKILLSTNGGTTYNTSPIAQSVDADDEEYAWDIPLFPQDSINAKIKIADVQNDSVYSISPAFTIYKSKVKFTWPEANARLQGRDTVHIAWSASNISKYKLDYRIDTLSTWVELPPELTGNTYTFDIPDTASNAMQMRVADKDNDRIWDTVTIRTYRSVLTFKYPGRLQTLKVEDTVNIRWSKVAVPSVRLSYQQLNSSSKIQIAVRSDSSYQWTIPGNLNGWYKLSIVDKDNDRILDTVTVKVVRANIVISGKPSSPEKKVFGDSIKVSWNSEFVNKFNVEVSDDGINYKPINSNLTTKNFSIRVDKSNFSPNGTEQAHIRIVDADFSKVRDSISFIIPKPSIEITKPSGGEYWESGKRFTLSWKDELKDTLAIWYRLFENSNWTKISDKYSDSSLQSIIWIADSQLVSGSYLFKVSSKDTTLTGTVVEDKSEAVSIFKYQTTDSVSQTVRAETPVSFGEYSESSSYRMLGIPGDDNLTVPSVMNGGEAGKDWKAYRDNGDSIDYLREWSPSGADNFSFTPGAAYWIHSKKGITLPDTVKSVKLAYKNESTPYFAIPLMKNKWNIISSPFLDEVMAAKIYSINGLDTSLKFFRYDPSSPSGYSVADELKPFIGYYFRSVNDRDSLKIPFKFNVSGGPSASPVVDFERQTNWSSVIRLSDKEGNVRDQLTFGINPLSSDGYDTHDILSPPADMPQFRLNGIAENGDIGRELVSQEFRQNMNDGQVFSLRVKKPKNTMEILTVTEPVNIGAESLCLIDTEARIAYNLREQPVVELNPVKQYQRFSLVVGSAGFVQQQLDALLPAEFVVYQNYPNPFNPVTMIRFGLPEEEKVTAEIYNALGERVALLINGRTLRAGYHEYPFDAARLSSGVYYLRVASGNRVAMKKMMLLK
ncbi:MAG: hypothetical protein AMXMBFR48_19380 [Ignavibacteriales bacterium]